MLDRERTAAPSLRATARSTSPTRSAAWRASASTPSASAARSRSPAGSSLRASRPSTTSDLPEVVSTLADEPRGIILVTGTTGSGKSTTLAAMVDQINRSYPKNIVTIEDPIEYLHRDQNSVVHQREVGFDTGSFPQALRRVLRQDPDVILIGEMRDEETVGTALSAAETGHLVLSTLHTIDAVETVNRIIDFFPPHHHQQVRAMLAGVASRRDLPAPRADDRRQGPRPRLRGAHDDRTRARHDLRPDRDRKARRGDRRGLLLRHADLRPGAAAPLRRRARSRWTRRSRPPRTRTTSSCWWQPRGSARHRSTRSTRPSTAATRRRRRPTERLPAPDSDRERRVRPSLRAVRLNPLLQSVKPWYHPKASTAVARRATSRKLGLR